VVVIDGGPLVVEFFQGGTIFLTTTFGVGGCAFAFTWHQKQAKVR